MAKARIEFQTFLDGLCSIYRLDKTRRPTLLLGNVRFQRRVVGAKRHWTAEQAGHNIEMVIRLPRADFITGGAFVVIGGKQYVVTQVQIIPDTLPQCTDLTLEQPELLLSFDESEVGAGGRY